MRGKAGMGASVRKSAEDQRPDTFEVRHDLIIPEAQHTEPFAMQEDLAVAIRSSVHVLTAIHLDDQSCFQTGEIGDVGADGMLATEAEAFQLPPAENAPQAAFRERHVAAELARAVAFLSLAHGHVLCGG
ncbi:hypothetical protein ASD77_09540 [Pseudoxanthomonas sp. Root65]|nr:hypothetical protein ASD77_09540 [Pseudoxanthomonas sp. Root65]